MEKITNITKNTSYLTFALILQKLVSFTYFTLLARNLGAENLGKYYFAISFATVFGIFVDIGLVNVLTREVAKEKEKAKIYLGNILFIKIGLTITTLLIAFSIISINGYDNAIKTLVFVALVCVMLDSFTATFWAVARGFHNLFFESISSVLFQVIVMTIGLNFMYRGFGLTYIILGLLFASIFHFLYSAIVLTKKFKISILPKFDSKVAKKILLIAVPFAFFAIFQRLYMYLDSVFLGFMAGAEHVGYYQISFKIIFALQFLPMAFVASLYPAMSNYWVNNREQLKITFEKALIYLMIISLPISAGVFVLADKIVLIFKDDFGPAVLPMRVIILSVLFIFINFPIGSLLNACDKQKRNTINMAIATVLSIAMNIVLIPRFQALGASITVLSTNFLMSFLGLFWAFKIVKFNFNKVSLAFFKIFSSAVAMGFLVFLLKEKLNIIILIFLGGVFYFSFLYLFKAIKKEELVYIYKSFLKK